MSWLNDAEVTTAEQKAALQAEAQQYLDDTDWYVTRHIETGKPVPEEVTAKRAECRVIL